MDITSNHLDFKPMKSYESTQGGTQEPEGDEVLKRVDNFGHPVSKGEFFLEEQALLAHTNKLFA